MTFGSAGQRGRWRLDRLRREAERRKLETRHAMALARHRRSVRRARGSALRFAAGVVGCAVAVALTSGFAELCWAVAGVACALIAGQSARTFLRLRRVDPPTAPQLPQAVPPLPSRGSAAWPALRRLETSVTAIRRLLPAMPGDLVELATPSVDAARAAYEMGRAQAAQIAATETALSVVGPADRVGLEQVRAGLLAELDLAAEAVEHLLTSCTRLIGTRSGDLPAQARGALSAATYEVVARTYGLRAATMTTRYADQKREELDERPAR